MAALGLYSTAYCNVCYFPLFFLKISFTCPSYLVVFFSVSVLPELHCCGGFWRQCAQKSPSTLATFASCVPPSGFGLVGTFRFGEFLTEREYLFYHHCCARIRVVFGDEALCKRGFLTCSLAHVSVAIWDEMKMIWLRNFFVEKALVNSLTAGRLFELCDVAIGYVHH